MVAELSAIQQIVVALTGEDGLGLPVVIVQSAVTTIYTSLGGFRISFMTDNIQGAMVVGLIIINIVTVGVKTEIDTSLIEPSGLLKPSLLGWQLIYILPVAVLTNDFFLSGFWMRTFASKTDRDLRIGTSIAAVAVSIILCFVGATGLLAVWSRAWKSEEDGSIAFFLLLGQQPAWVAGIVLAMTICLSTAAFDSFQSAMVSSGSNDLFRNKLNIWVIRLLVVLIIFPVCVVALKSPDILQVYLISDLVSASSVPVLMIGLCDRFYWWSGAEVIIGGLGGILAVFIFGSVYYGNASDGGKLILLENGLYANDWSAFGMMQFEHLDHFSSSTGPANIDASGAFVAAPVGGLLFALAALTTRVVCQWIYAKATRKPFTAFQKPDTTVVPSFYTGRVEDDEQLVEEYRDEEEEESNGQHVQPVKVTAHQSK